MASRLHNLTVRSSDPEVLLGWERDGSAVVPAAAAPLQLVFAPTDLPRAGLNQIHFHLTSNATPQAATVARALELGGAHLDAGQLPEEDHVVLADPDGNEFCVIEEGNNWLAGTGFLGELAADGTRDVGLFWAEALDWPLVHDEDGETAISPPGGGFKIAWGGSRSTSDTGATGCSSCWWPTSWMRRSIGSSGSVLRWSSLGATRWRWRIRMGASSWCASRSRSTTAGAVSAGGPRPRACGGGP